MTLPNQIDGLLFERVASFVIVQAEGLGFTVKWDTKVVKYPIKLFPWNFISCLIIRQATVTIDVNHALWNRTAGLCGRINGMWVDDFENRDGTRSSSLLGFVNSWEASGLTGMVKHSLERHLFLRLCFCSLLSFSRLITQ